MDFSSLLGGGGGGGGGGEFGRSTAITTLSYNRTGDATGQGFNLGAVLGVGLLIVFAVVLIVTKRS